MRLEDVSIPPRPSWMDRYAGENPGDMRFFNISKLMSLYGFDRAHAVEVQNHYRDLSRQQTGTAPQWLATAVERARHAAFEDDRKLEQLARAKFIVVFDLDDTLYDQFYDPTIAQSCYDLVVPQDTGGLKHIKLAPGANEIIDRVAALGGAVVIFTAAPDAMWANLRAWPFAGATLPEHPSIAAILTNSHLVLQEKSEDTGADDPRRGHPVIEPSKDLRILDESLRRVIIVDDNPLRLFQFRNARIVEKFDADRYCTSSDPKVRKAYESTLPTVLHEIEESIRWMDAHDASFAQAYLPYSHLGQLAVAWLQQTGMGHRSAIDYLRRHPELAETRF